ncbi:Protein PET117 -like mitochondrial [Scophthalmus maximus]|uniref:Protein PET117-like mitochondrial n=1 Tax=Scophthalmus maximus TaxID=52904 RepID=A0A2U9BN04_SCOMX|nr:Protein PET117 -like mitochondrial [Scophthalmus maximus]
MSTASKVVLGLSVVLTAGTVATVHLKQDWDRQLSQTNRRGGYIRYRLFKIEAADTGRSSSGVSSPPADLNDVQKFVLYQ